MELLRCNRRRDNASVARTLLRTIVLFVLSWAPESLMGLTWEPPCLCQRFNHRVAEDS